MDPTPQRNPNAAPTSSSVNGWLVAILLVLVAALILQMSGGMDRLLYPPNALPRAITARGDLAGDEKSQIELFRHASPSVVHITSLALGRDRLSLNLLEVPRGSGSGFIWDLQGHVVTNFHVVQDAYQSNGQSRLRVTLVDNSTWNGVVIGVAPDKDLAVVQIEAPAHRLTPIPIGTSADLQVGQNAFAIGNPFNLDQTLTTGVISGLGRDIQAVTGRTISGVIQTDAAINPGNSGGPLLDSAGRLIGVNTAIYSPSGAYAGIGFAVPVDIVNRIVPLLIRDGEVQRPGLGINVFDQSIVERLQQLGSLERDGVLIRDVLPESAAAKAGLLPTRQDEQGQLDLGDLIVAVDGQPVEKLEDLFDVLDRHQVGDTITVTVLRDGEEKEIAVTLQALPSISP